MVKSSGWPHQNESIYFTNFLIFPLIKGEFLVWIPNKHIFQTVFIKELYLFIFRGQVYQLEHNK